MQSLWSESVWKKSLSHFLHGAKPVRSVLYEPGKQTTESKDDKRVIKPIVYIHCIVYIDIPLQSFILVAPHVLFSNGRVLCPSGQVKQNVDWIWPMYCPFWHFWQGASPCSWLRHPGSHLPMHENLLLIVKF